LQIHYRGLQRILSSRQPEADPAREAYIAWFVRALGYLYEFASLARPRPTVKSRLTLLYPPAPLSQAYCRLLSNIPSGFVDLALSRKISLQLARILIDMGDLNKTFNQSNHQDPSHEATMRVLSRVYEIFHATRSQTEAHLCQGLIAYCILLRWSQDPITFTTVTYPALWLRDEHPGPEVQLPVAIWVAFSLALALSLNPMMRSRALECVRQIFARYPVAKRWEFVAHQLKGFFWNETFMRGWEGLWDQAVVGGGRSGARPRELLESEGSIERAVVEVVSS
jgi:hypothetical protein